MSKFTFKRTEKKFYVNERGQACFRMTVSAKYAGSEVERAVWWDFPLSTLALDGEGIGGPAIESAGMDLLVRFDRRERESLKNVVDALQEAFFALFAVGIFAYGVPIENADDAKVAWAAEARAFLLELEGEKIAESLENIFASGDGEEVDEEHVHEVTFAAQWVRNNNDARQGILLAQFPQVDGVKDVWTEDAEGWMAATVRGSHTIPAHIGVDPNSRAWQSALDTMKKWAAEHGENPFVVHAENDGDYLALDDIADARLYAEFELDEEV